MEEPKVPQSVSFRPSKRQKIFRQRKGSEDDDSDGDMSSPASPARSALGEASPLYPPSDGKEDNFSLSDVLRMRKVAQRRKGGVEFSSSTPQPQASFIAPAPPPSAEQSTALSNPVSLIHSRFAPPTGQVADVDKHMIAYVETEMTKLRNAHPSNSLSAPASTNPHDANGQTLSSNGALLNGNAAQRQPASLGKLHEIDLGTEARRRNIERTQAAVEGQPSQTEEKEEPVKMRLCRDGKFRPRRRRKRRGSDDLKRDRLVEDILQESRLEIYDHPPSASSSAQQAPKPGDSDVGDQEAADDELAEKFRKEFLENVAARHAQHRKQKKKDGRPKEKSDDKIGGPKLGGSRSQRAAMHARQVAEKQAEREKGKK